MYVDPGGRWISHILIVLAVSLTAASGWAGVVEDRFEGAELDSTIWKAEAHGQLALGEGTVHLLSTLSRVPTRLALATPLADGIYGVRFDFRPDADHQDGYAFVVQHGEEGSQSIYWYLEFMAGGQKVSGYRHVNRQWSHCGMADLTLHGKIDPFKTWYRVEVRNRPKQANVRVLLRDSGQEVWRFEAVHDDGPPAPLFFAASASIPRRKADLGGYLGNFFLAGPAVAARRLSVPAGEKELLCVKGGKIAARVGQQGRVSLFRPGANAAFASVFPSAQVMGENQTAAITHVCTRPHGERGFLQEWSSDTAAVRVRLQYSVTPEQPWIDARICLANADAKEKQVRIALHVGYPEKTDWGYLWRRYYCEANPWLRCGPVVPSGALTAGLPDAKDP